MRGAQAGTAPPVAKHVAELSGRSAIVSGGSRGLGFAISSAFLGAGMEVLICGREGETLARAQAELTNGAPAGSRCLAEVADVGRPADVDRVVARALEAFGKIDVLVNNAGILGPTGPVETVEWEEWVEALRVNLFGSVSFCRAVLPHMKSRRAGKIIQLSGGGATSPMPGMSAYAASKAAVVRFVETLAGETQEWGIAVNAMAPGALNTRLLDEVLAAGPEKVGKAYYERALRQRESGGAPPSRGAELALFLASSASDGITGKLVSAIWDPWSELGSHVDDLAGTDVYALRRILPADRGLKWGEG